MKMEFSLYETSFVVNGKEMKVDTKACAIGRKNLLKTEIFRLRNKKWDMVDAIDHDANDDLENLHYQIVEKYREV